MDESWFALVSLTMIPYIPHSDSYALQSPRKLYRSKVRFDLWLQMWLLNLAAPPAACVRIARLKGIQIRRITSGSA
jgi:hypothetical protein